MCALSAYREFVGGSDIPRQQTCQGEVYWDKVMSISVGNLLGGVKTVQTLNCLLSNNGLDQAWRCSPN